MNPRLTWWLLALAAVLFSFIYLVERRTRATPLAPEPIPRLLAIRAAAVTNIQLRITNRLVVRAERTNNDWNVTLPLFYPAQAERIEGLLAAIEGLSSQKRLTVTETGGNRKAAAEFGLEVPLATLTLQHEGQRSEILFGSKTPLGDQVYIQLLASSTIYIVNSDLFDRLPRSADDWRDDSLLALRSPLAERIERIEVRAAGRGFAVQFDPTNRTYTLTKPTPARADAPKVEALLRKLAASRVVRFETDTPLAELEPYGLQPPTAELLLGQGTNDLVTIQFGKSPTNDPTVVYARRLSHTNVVLVSQVLLDALLAPYSELRDRHLLTFTPATVDIIEVTGTNGFSLQRQTNGNWMIASTPPIRADSGLAVDWLDALSRLQGNVEKDVVTDFASYGLVPPAGRYLLQTLLTNGAPAPTNHVVAQIEFSTPQGDKIYVRRPDESSLYSLPRADFESLPSAAWQLRDRRVFNFSTNQVASLLIRYGGYERKLLRGLNGEWSLAPGSQGIINTFAIEEMMFRLGGLRAVLWVDRGLDARARRGFTDTGHKITIELKLSDKPLPLALEFGGRSPANIPYALALVDGEPTVFEIPVALFYDIARYLTNPSPPKSPGK